MSESVRLPRRLNPSGHSEPAKPRRRQRTRFRVVLGLLIIGFGLYVLLQIHFAKYGYFIVTSESMLPAIDIGDRLVMMHPAHYQVGDIVVFRGPLNPSDMLVKRLVAIGPSQVEISRDRLFVNGQPADPPKTMTPPDPAANPRRPDQVWNLKPGEIFVAGDNRANSEDSRDFGPLSLDVLRGAVRYRVDRWYRWVKMQ